MNPSHLTVVTVVGISATVTLILLWMLSVPSSPVTSGPAPSLLNAPFSRYVSTAGTDSGDCTDGDLPRQTIHYAADAASEGSTIIVASGTYPNLTRGGFAFDFRAS